jgi:hypothetical protein
MSPPAANSLFFEILLNGLILPPPVVLATYPKVSSAKNYRATTEELTYLMWRGGFFLKQ